MSEKKCVIEYKTRSLNGLVYDYKFFDLKKCCWIFKTTLQKGIIKIFEPSCHQKSVSISNMTISFCPFCGAKIELKEAKVVRLERKMITVTGELEEIS